MQQISQQRSEAAVQTNPVVAIRSSAVRFITRQSTTVQIFAAMLLGMLMLYGVGFASIDLAHNAAHDGRHAVAFPCH